MAAEIVRLLDRVVAERRSLPPGFQLGLRNIDRTTPLSRALRQLRERAELTQEEVARQTEWSQSKVIRIETGDVGVSATDAMALLRVYGVRSPRTRDNILNMVREDRARRRG
jgi:DNA-binding XRE family transcriptional regulator